MSDASVLNTHTYDGNLAITDLSLLNIVKCWTQEQKSKCGSELIQHLSNRQALVYLQTIVASIGTSANIDPSNNLVADDLICLAWLLRNNNSFITELEIQLLDMATGFCPQGRTHRLFQVLLAFVKQLDELEDASPPEL